MLRKVKKPGASFHLFKKQMKRQKTNETSQQMKRVMAAAGFLEKERERELGEEFGTGRYRGLRAQGAEFSRAHD